MAEKPESQSAPAPADLHWGIAYLREDIQDVRQEMRQDIQDVRQEMRQEFQNVRQEFQNVRQEVRQEVQGVCQEVQQEIRTVNIRIDSRFYARHRDHGHHDGRNPSRHQTLIRVKPLQG